MVENPYRRQGRSRGRRQEEQSDAITATLAVQVLVCVLLLLLAVLWKKRDESKYWQMKQQYTSMVTEEMNPEEFGQVLAEGQSAWQRVFAAIENMISGLIARFTGDPGQSLEQPVPDEPADVLPEEQSREADFRFDYLSPADPVYRAAVELPTELGAVDMSTIGKATSDGCTLSGVVLAARIKPPVTGLITSDFAYREHPLSGNDDFHNGMDIAAEEGRQVLAALPGEVVEAGWSEIYGNYMILQHSAELQTFYAHCSELIADEGMTVAQGARIAKVGQTGVATGPHLHFSVIVDGQYTDPYWVLRDNIKLVERQ